MNIAIDGPAAAGKSTIAKRLAEILEFRYIDTGAMYRAVTLYALNNGFIKSSDSIIQSLDQIHISLTKEQPQRVLLNEVDVTDEIRSQQVTDNVSYVASIKQVRRFLVEQQQQFIKNGEVIMDGRDIGTTVIPNADVKFYMIAHPRTRALRRFEENKLRGIHQDINLLEQEIIDRDQKDISRKESPLQKANDAIEIDTSNMTIDEVVEQMLNIIQRFKTSQ